MNYKFELDLKIKQFITRKNYKPILKSPKLHDKVCINYLLMYKVPMSCKIMFSHLHLNYILISRVHCRKMD